MAKIKTEWRDVSGYAGLYQVSDAGFIKSVDRPVTLDWKGRKVTKVYKGKLIKSRLQNAGYYVVWLSKQGVITAHTVHSIGLLPKLLLTIRIVTKMSTIRMAIKPITAWKI